MVEDTKVTSFLTLLKEKNWLELYKKTLINIIYFGVLIFVGGIYIFPNDSGTQQAFYLLVTLPFLLLFPFVIKELKWKNLSFLCYILFPVYMFISHFWADEENLTRGWFFFFRQLICFVIFYFAIEIIIERKINFIEKLLVFVMVVGSVSGVLSLIQFYLNYESYPEKFIRGFSIVDVDKVGAIHAIHSGICISIIAGWKDKFNCSIGIFAIIGLIVSVAIIFFTKTLGNWIVLFLIFAAVIFLKYLKYWKLSLLIFSVFILIGVFFVVGSWGLLKKDPNILIRYESIQFSINSWVESILAGHGLVYKKPFDVPTAGFLMVHPHNFMFDILRFGGLLGVLFMLLQVISPIVLSIKNLELKKDIFVVIPWMVGGVLALSFYGQQPYVRPGSYIWFFYWIPIAILAANLKVSKVNCLKNQI